MMQKLGKKTHFSMAFDNGGTISLLKRRLNYNKIRVLHRCLGQKYVQLGV